eukprot:CFRG8274T1
MLAYIWNLVKIARVLYEYDKENEDEISFKAGDTIEITRDFVYDGWMEGTLLPGRTEVGLFPSNFVEIEEVHEKKGAAPPIPAQGKNDTDFEDDEDESLSGGELDVRDMQVVIGKKLPDSLKSGKKPKLVKAHHLYVKTQPDELTFHDGDIIEIISEDHPDWWQGKLNGVTGWLPSNFVDPIPEESKAKSQHKQSSTPDSEIEKNKQNTEENRQSSSRKLPGAIMAMPSVGAGAGAGGDNIPKWKKDLLAKNAAKSGGVSTHGSATNTPSHEDTHKPDWMSMRQSQLNNHENDKGRYEDSEHKTDVMAGVTEAGIVGSASGDSQISDKSNKSSKSNRSTSNASFGQPEEQMRPSTKTRSHMEVDTAHASASMHEEDVDTDRDDNSSDDDHTKEPDGFQLQKEILDLKRLLGKERQARRKLQERVSALERAIA